MDRVYEAVFADLEMPFVPYPSLKLKFDKEGDEISDEEFCGLMDRVSDPTGIITIDSVIYDTTDGLFRLYGSTYAETADQFLAAIEWWTRGLGFYTL